MKYKLACADSRHIDHVPSVSSLYNSMQRTYTYTVYTMAYQRTFSHIVM